MECRDKSGMTDEGIGSAQGQIGQTCYAARMKRFPALLALALAAPAAAQDAPARRYRVALGPELAPRYPGAGSLRLQPLVNVDRARGDEPFAFEAPDEGFAIPLHVRQGFAIGPALDFQSSRRARDVGVAVPEVGFTVELGGFAQYQLAPAFRLRAEVRKGLGGHRAVVADLGADWVRRDRDRWLLSLGPRLTLADDRYARAYFGVAPRTAAATGLRPFTPRGGLQAVGATAGALRQFGARWGLYGYARYDRLVDDAARSPLVRGHGSRDQFSGGLALSYTFTRR